jgi:hypothetical protein
MGSFSRIEQTSPSKTTHELYGSGDLHIGRLLHNRRFDFAMVAFLDCLKGLIDYIKSQDPTVDFPHQSVSIFFFYCCSGVYGIYCQDRQGQDWRCVCQATIQPGGCVDTGFEACVAGTQDSTQVGN